MGGGYIAFEFAHIAARAGVHATILHRHAHALPHFDPDLVTKLIDATRASGIKVALEHEATGIETTGTGYTVHTAAGRSFPEDLVVHAAGRVPELDGRDLDAASIRHDPRCGIPVDDHLRSTTSPHVYAAGDAADPPAGRSPPSPSTKPTPPPPMSSTATPRSRITRGIPSVVFTTLNLGRAGVLESEARAAGREVTIRHQDTHTWYSVRRVAQPCAGYKIIEDAGSGEILGAHLLGDHTCDAINMFALAIRHHLTAKDLKTSILVPPADASDVRAWSEAVFRAAARPSDRQRWPSRRIGTAPVARTRATDREHAYEARGHWFDRFDPGNYVTNAIQPSQRRSWVLDCSQFGGQTPRAIPRAAGCRPERSCTGPRTAPQWWANLGENAPLHRW